MPYIRTVSADLIPVRKGDTVYLLQTNVDSKGRSKWFVTTTKVIEKDGNGWVCMACVPDSLWCCREPRWMVGEARIYKIKVNALAEAARRQYGNRKRVDLRQELVDLIDRDINKAARGIQIYPDERPVPGRQGPRKPSGSRKPTNKKPKK